MLRYVREQNCFWQTSWLVSALFAERLVEDGSRVLGLLALPVLLGLLAGWHLVHLLNVAVQRAHRGELKIKKLMRQLIDKLSLFNKNWLTNLESKNVVECPKSIVHSLHFSKIGSWNLIMGFTRSIKEKNGLKMMGRTSAKKHAYKITLLVASIHPWRLHTGQTVRPAWNFCKYSSCFKQVVGESYNLTKRSSFCNKLCYNFYLDCKLILI